jgi:hypothetical protein
MKIQIKPAPRFLTYLEIAGVNVSLDNSALVSGYVSNPEGLKEPYSLYMDSETYAEWGTDDAFVIDWTLEQLGLERP